MTVQQRAGPSGDCWPPTAAPGAHRRHRGRPRAQSRHQRSSHYAQPQLAAGRLENRIVVLGAGPAGLATAVALQAAGLPVVVLERRAAGENTGTALGLWTNAWQALDALGAAAQLRQQHPAIDRIELCRDDGRLLRGFSLNQDCEGGPHEFRGVQRASLLRALEARLEPDTVQYGCRVEALQTSKNGATLQLGRGQQLDCLAVVAADGGRSMALSAAGRSPPKLVGQTAIRGIARSGAAPVIRQVWSRGPRAGMYPISADLTYWFVCFDDVSDALSVPLSPAAIKGEALKFVRGWHWDIEAAVEATPLDSITRSRIADRWDLPFGGSTGAITLGGDALHPMTPNLGQGGGVALEDAVVLARLLAAQPGLVEAVSALADCSSGSSTAVREAAHTAVQAAFRRYEALRLQRCLPLTVRSWAMGQLLQLQLPPVVFARDAFVQYLFSPAHFLEHATYNCSSQS